MTQKYFLGGTSPSGFKTDFIKQIKKPGYYTYILKGGPGSGKSTFMKKLAEKFKKYEDTDIYCCSSDPVSLDAVVFHNRRIIIVDGTAPHTFEPEFPGIKQEIIDLGTFWDKNFLAGHSDAILYCMQENSAYHKQAGRFLKAASSVTESIYSTALSALNTKKLDAFTERLSAKLFTFKDKFIAEGKTEIKQLSAFTPDGYITQPVSENYNIYLLKDDFFAGSDYFLKKLTEAACLSGLNVIVSLSYAFDDTVYEHVLIPEINAAFISSNCINEQEYENAATVNFNRFYIREKISERKSTLSFDRKVLNEIISEISKSLDIALKIHNQLETYYINSLDIKKLNKFTEDYFKNL